MPNDNSVFGLSVSTLAAKFYKNIFDLYSFEVALFVCPQAASNFYSLFFCDTLKNWAVMQDISS